MRIVSFNINSIRARPHQLEYIRDVIKPDVIGLQETKVNDPDFPLEVVEEIGYHTEYWGQVSISQDEGNSISGVTPLFCVLSPVTL